MCMRKSGARAQIDTWRSFVMGLFCCVCACVFYRESVEERKREGARSDGYMNNFLDGTVNVVFVRVYV